MDTSNGRPTRGARGAVGDSTMESHNWRAQPQRRRIVNKIMDTLKKNLPFSGYERLQELKKIAERVEDEIYTAATSQSEYSRKICFMMLTIETRLQNPMVDSMQSNSAALHNSLHHSVPFDPIAQTDNPNGGDWQQEVYQKIKAMKDLYLLDLRPIQDARDVVADLIMASDDWRSTQSAGGAMGDPIMASDDWRPTQSAGGAIGDPTMESVDWRAQLQADSRQRIVNKIMDTLKRHLPFSGPEGLHELKKIAVRFEEKIYTAATSQSDYLRKISLKMLTMETRSQNPMSDPMQSNSTANSVNPSDPGSQVMQQVNNQGQQLPIPVPSNNIQQGQQMMSQSMHNNIGSTGMQGSSSLSSGLPPGSGLQQPILTTGQNSNLQNIQNMSSVQQNTVGNTMGNNNFANQRQIPGRQQLVPQQQQQQQQQPQTQNSHYLYQQQLQQMAKQKLQQPAMQTQQQQQQQNMLQPGHLQPSQQSVIQPAMMQSSSLPTGVQNQQPVVPPSSQTLMNHQQSVLRQQRQQQVQPIQQQVQQAQQNPMGQQTNATNMQQNQFIGQQNNYSDMQQQQQRLIGQQNKLSSLQQPQQQLIGQHNNLSSMQQQQSGQQQQLLGNQSGNTSMQNNQHSVQQMLQSNKMPIQQQNQQSSANMLPTQVQQSQPQLQQQVKPHMQSQPGQLQQQQQVGMQQQSNLLQRDMQQRLPTTGGFPQQNVMDQQKQLFQQQRAMPEASSTSLDSTAGNANGGDWQEEVYQKIKAMKDLYLLDLNDMHQKILSKLQQHDSLPQQPKNEQLEKLKVFKNMLERFMQFLQIPKLGILVNYKDKLGTYEKQIINIINSNRRKPAAPQQQAQALPPQHMQSLQQAQQTHSQLTQVQSHDQMNLQGSMAAMQPNNMGNLQQNAVSLSGGSNAQQNI